MATNSSTCAPTSACFARRSRTIPRGLNTFGPNRGSVTGFETRRTQINQPACPKTNSHQRSFLRRSPVPPFLYRPYANLMPLLWCSPYTRGVLVLMFTRADKRREPAIMRRVGSERPTCRGFSKTSADRPDHKKRSLGAPAFMPFSRLELHTQWTKRESLLVRTPQAPQHLRSALVWRFLHLFPW